MDIYKDMYFRLFNKLTDTIVELDTLKASIAETQCATEEQFLSQEEPVTTK